MRSPILRGLLMLVLVLYASSNAFASQTSDIGVVLESSSRVVVLEGSVTDPNAVAKSLLVQLADDDEIALVMLPAGSGSADTLNQMAEQLARQIDENTGNQFIVGVAVENILKASTTRLPNGVAETLMHKAEVISTGSPVDALGTFVRLVHEWQDAHPKPKPTSTSDEGLNNAQIMLLVLSALAALLAGVSLVRLRWARDTRFRHSPKEIRELLLKIADLNQRINDLDMRSAVNQLTVDLEELARKFGKSSAYNKVDLKYKLGYVVEILEQFLEIEDSPARYISRTESERVKDASRRSITAFDDHVLQAIRDGNSVALVEFTINVESLDPTV